MNSKRKVWPFVYQNLKTLKTEKIRSHKMDRSDDKETVILRLIEIFMNSEITKCYFYDEIFYREKMYMRNLTQAAKKRKLVKKR